ncbi:hypothetical protein GCM10027038_25540 [Arthrobacter bambusae]
MPASSAPLKLFVILPVTQEFVAGRHLDGWIYIIPVLPEILLIAVTLFPQSEHRGEDTWKTQNCAPQASGLGGP